MSGHQHLDADTLSAFVEGVLPEHERAHCLAHLAECSECRDVAFLSQEVPAISVVPIRRRRFELMPLLAAAAAVCFALLGTWIYLRSRIEPSPRGVVAHEASPIEPTESAKPVEVPPPTVIAEAPRRRPTLVPTEPPPGPTKPREGAPSAPVEPPVIASEQSQVQVRAVPTPTLPTITIQPEAASVAAISAGISGVVIDASGAVVPQATVELLQSAGAKKLETRTDEAGKFNFTDLKPGQYELEITRAGFRKTSQRVEVRAQEVAAVKSELQVGSTAETVEVTAAPATIQTDSASVSSRKQKRGKPFEPRPLPSKLPVETKAASGKIMLAVDSAGTLFFSGNAGKSWKAVKPQWPSKITDLMTPPDAREPGKAVFQITTEADVDWLSRDGRHWYPAPKNN